MDLKDPWVLQDLLDLILVHQVIVDLQFHKVHHHSVKIMVHQDPYLHLKGLWDLQVVLRVHHHHI